MTKAKIIASGPAPKTKGKKAPAKKNVVETVVAEVKEELNEPVDTVTIRKSWLVVAAIAAAALTLGHIVL